MTKRQKRRQRREVHVKTEVETVEISSHKARNVWSVQDSEETRKVSFLEP